MGEGWDRLRVEIGRFMAVGGIATLAAFLVFNFLVHGLYLTSDPWLGGHPVTAFVIANVVGMLISYRLSRYWTFKHRPPQHADGGRTAYFAISTVTMLIPMVLLWVSRNVLGLDDPVSDNIAGVVIGQGLGQVARFHLFRTYVFQKPTRAHLPAFLHLSEHDRAGLAGLVGVPPLAPLEPSAPPVSEAEETPTGSSTRDRVPPAGP